MRRIPDQPCARCGAPTAGLASYCPPCSANYQRTRRRLATLRHWQAVVRADPTNRAALMRLMRRVTAPTGKKWCGWCGGWRWKKQFARDRCAADGLQGYCKNCRSIQYHLKRWEQRQGETG